MRRPPTARPNEPRTAAGRVAAAWLAACTLAAGATVAAVDDARTPRFISLPENPQALGDPEAGFEYLLYGDYIGSGLPKRLFASLLGNDPAEPLLDREGLAAGLPHVLNAFTMPSGAEVVAGINCLGCHSQELNGELVIGLGNTTSDWTADEGLPIDALHATLRLIYPPDHPERLAAEQFLRGAAQVNGKVSTPFAGVNPAFRIEEVAAAHRDPETLAWTDEPGYAYPERTIASDVPPWWNVKKKHALYYNGLGRGDFSKLIQQINVVAIGDKEDAKRINRSMQDLLAFIFTIEPPPYPGPIDSGLALEGATVFEQNCAKCHGTYSDGPDGNAWTYPNKLIPVERVGTDPEYARALTESGLHTWFNQSWYATSEPTARAEPSLTYIAPPLDGIWATAPYLHNGSIPTLEGVLDSTARPTFWRRELLPEHYDASLPGWKHTVEPGPTDANTYNTTIPGFGNQGHTYGDDLVPAERRALIEYLKTL